MGSLLPIMDLTNLGMRQLGGGHTQRTPERRPRAAPSRGPGRAAALKHHAIMIGTQAALYWSLARRRPAPTSTSSSWSGQ